MREACRALDELEVSYETTIVSAHRTPARLMDYAAQAAGRGLAVIIAGAGGAAHLPGMVAAVTPLPVIGVPVRTSSLSGLDSLLSIVQMPAGVPVATVAINNARNAGILAAQIVGVRDGATLERVRRYKEDLRQRVEDKAARLEAAGPFADGEGS